MTRIGVFGWGVVAPRSRNVEAFAERLAEGGQWLAPFDGFGPSNFLVGAPDFDFTDYRDWIASRFPPNRFVGLNKKMGTPTKYAIGAFIQALGQNPEVEAELNALGTAAQCIVGGGLHDIPTYTRITLEAHRAQRRWDRFWADPANNSALRAYLSEGTLPTGLQSGTPSDATAQESSETADSSGIPDAPSSLPIDERDEAEERYWAFWARRSPELQTYLAELVAIESMSVEGDVESGKQALIRRKRSAIIALRKKWKAPEPPWDQVSSNALWNIGNTPASQISMLGKIKGMAFAPFAACSSFGYALKLGIDSIRRGEAKLVVVGATDPKPHPVSVGTFYNARVLANDGKISKPLTGLQGTHVSGGATIWIIGDLEHYQARGWRALGMEPLAVGLSADADHIITPSVPGPTAAIRGALREAKVEADQIGDWDLHATGTPGDYLEVHTATKELTPGARLSARKGTFGHGMGAGGGWELTAQYLGFEAGQIFPTSLTPEEVNPEIGEVNRGFVYDQATETGSEHAGKLSMGVGGINACIISRKLPRDQG